LNSLDWGRLYHFEFVADAPPTGTGDVHLVGAATSTEAELPYQVSMLVPAGPDDTLFKNGFD
jgi:hypothetical protein